MSKKEKTIRLLVLLVMVFVFIAWLVNLKHVWKKEEQKNNPSPVQDSLGELKTSFKELREKIDALKENFFSSQSANGTEEINQQNESPEFLNEEEINRLKEKVLKTVTDN